MVSEPPQPSWVISDARPSNNGANCGVVELVVVVDVVVVVGVAVVVGVVVVVADVEVVVLVVLGVGVVTVNVGSEVETAVPFLLFAVTTTRSVEPASVFAARYVCADADAMGEQELPLLVQRAHWYA